MVSDKNKNISAITYNHLNLPVKISFGGSYPKIEYLYAADGRKLKKTVSANAQNITATDYLDGFQYTEGTLDFFPTAEGYVDYVKDAKEAFIISSITGTIWAT